MNARNLTPKQRAMMDSLVPEEGLAWGEILPEEQRTARSLARRGLIELSETEAPAGDVHMEARLVPDLVWPPVQGRLAFTSAMVESVRLGAAAIAMLNPEQMHRALEVVRGTEPSFEDVLDAHAHNRRAILAAELMRQDVVG